MRLHERRHDKRKTTISASSPSYSAEEFPDIEVPTLSFWLRAFVNNAQGPLKMTIPPTSQRTREDVAQLSMAFWLGCCLQQWCGGHSEDLTLQNVVPDRHGDSRLPSQGRGFISDAEISRMKGKAAPDWYRKLAKNYVAFNAADRPSATDIYR
ncbi:hypothetical protein F5146DRAFT_1004240 [Armillaria mellea]|nr:hypothetical protein F5146DRAFT_1004240 [Armillaria mellea]